MPVHIANFFDADRRSAKALEAMTYGNVVKVSDDGSGGRKLLKLLDADAAELVNGKYGIVYKVSVDPASVGVSDVTDPTTANRVETIFSGDDVIEVRRGAIIEYTADFLHASLDPARAGATPVVGDALGIKDSQWSTAGTAGAIATPVVGRVFRVHGTTVLVELV